MNLSRCVNWFALVIAGGLLIPAGPGFDLCERAGAAEADQPAKAEAAVPLGRYITVTSPVDDVLIGRVRNAALDLQSRAVKEHRRAVLILEITPGTSRFLQVYGLAKDLNSADVAGVTTVAWIPERVTGHNVVLALACNEIVMHPDAELGDIGGGKPLDRDERQLLLDLVEKRHNRKLSPALVEGMFDPSVAVMKISVQPAGSETTETRIVSRKELDELRQTKLAILDVKTIKEQGVVGTFSGAQARDLDVLAVQTAETRNDLADLYNLPSEDLRDNPTEGEAPKVRLIKIEDVITPVTEAFVERQIQRAVDDGANLIIFEIQSPGGFLLSSKNLAYAIADLDPDKVRTVAYIPQEALSGAAMIAMGCDEIYMQPHAKLGDAGPIEIQPGQQFERAPEKVLSLLREILRELAERKHRPPALAMAMADKDLKVYQVTNRDTQRVWYMTEDEIHNSNGEWIQGRLVPETEKNLLLTVNGRRAHELELAEPPVQDRDELKLRLGIPLEQKLVAAGPTWVDSLVFWLNTGFATFLLLVIGVICLYLELHFVSGLLGIISTLCFALFFWSRFLSGTAGWLEVILFGLGVGCLALEIFVIPGFGVFGVSGGLMILASLVMAGQTFGNFEPSADFDTLAKNVGILSASIVTVVVLAMLMSRFLPHIPVLNQMILAPPGLDGPGTSPGPQLRPEVAGGTSYGRRHSLVGQRGQTVSVLRPAGKARIGDEYVDVVSDGPYIPQGSQIEVVQVAGNRVVVREV